jgi:hypothetical protein
VLISINGVGTPIKVWRAGGCTQHAVHLVFCDLSLRFLTSGPFGHYDISVTDFMFFACEEYPCFSAEIFAIKSRRSRQLDLHVYANANTTETTSRRAPTGMRAHANIIAMHFVVMIQISNIPPLQYMTAWELKQKVLVHLAASRGRFIWFQTRKK